MKFHELSNIFPLMEGEAFEGLCADIKANDLRDQIVTLDSKILDGRNRYRACNAARYTIPAKMFRVFNPKVDGDPLTWVISKNLQRRHLNETQRAWVASKIATLTHGGDRSKPSIEGLMLADVTDIIDNKVRSGSLIIVDLPGDDRHLEITGPGMYSPLANPFLECRGRMKQPWPVPLPLPKVPQPYATPR